MTGCTFTTSTFCGFGIGRFPDRKKWALYSMSPPNSITVLAYFQSEEAAQMFEQIVSDMIPHEERRGAGL